MARILIVLAAVVSGGAALAQPIEQYQNRLILQDQQREMQRQSLERRLDSRDLSRDMRDRTVRNQLELRLQPRPVTPPVTVTTPVLR